MTNTQKLLKIALDADPSLTVKMFEALDAAANDDFDWQVEQANDPGYDAWIEEQAMTFNYSHARMPGE
jgi:hypothetical protein